MASGGGRGHEDIGRSTDCDGGRGRGIRTVVGRHRHVRAVVGRHGCGRFNDGDGGDYGAGRAFFGTEEEAFVELLSEGKRVARGP